MKFKVGDVLKPKECIPGHTLGYFYSVLYEHVFYEYYIKRTNKFLNKQFQSDFFHIYTDIFRSPESVIDFLYKGKPWNE